MLCFSHYCHYFVVDSLPFTFPTCCCVQNPLSEYENEDVHYAANYTIPEANSPEMNSGGEQLIV